VVIIYTATGVLLLGLQTHSISAGDGEKYLQLIGWSESEYIE